MILKKVVRLFTIVVGSLALVLLFAFIFFWAKYRIPTGPIIEYQTRIRYQMIDMGQLEPSQVRYWFLEPITRHQRLFLEDGPLVFIYASKSQAAQCCPEPPSEMQAKGYVIEVSYQTRALRFANGTAPAKLTYIKQVPGRPRMSK